MPEMMKSARLVWSDGINSANGVSLHTIFTPRRLASSFARSTSSPPGSLVAGSRYSIGAYVELTVSFNAPACLISAGSSAACADVAAASAAMPRKYERRVMSDPCQRCWNVLSVCVENRGFDNPGAFGDHPVLLRPPVCGEV